ncbi:hypothetical protein [Haemophilus haemolyticus]|jgi:hypothetical protein|uniref:Uncharacterized protein n=1 Tax=Haemophilus haemolyticus TaxID=726 RepID=A0A0M3GAR6_HAEHA|nr:hypothetical protein [Haemophilus haemolyticus]KKZ59662.1 hypothetical protein AAX18_00100 [Haemophilus haemolyticus]
MINDEKLKQKRLEVLKYVQNVNNTDEKASKINLCFVLLNTLIYLGSEKENILPFAFRKYSYALEQYINSSNIADDASYLICASFLKEYYFYIKYIKDDNKDKPEIFDAYNTWEIFLRNEFQIKGQGIFDFNYYKNLKNDRFLDYFYLSLSIQERKFKSKLEQLENAKVNGLREINERKGTLDSELQNFDKNIIKNRNETNELASLLEKQKTAFNFVGLSKGFEKILKKKTCAKWTSFVLLFLITLSMFTILGYYHNSLPDEPTEIFDFWKFLMPYLGLEFILLYLFRVVLKHYNSIQTQIMQIELRQSLCQFIQSYADYAKEIKEKDGTSLDKFENLIFSSIVSTSEQVPSTFDGLEHITNLIKSAKS